MDYQALARQWRPKTFQDVVGQEPILRMLSNALQSKRLHHAYLLTGTRGVGKTTTARILVKCLNCETGITAQPCGTCRHCQSIDAGTFLDLFEVDAASRTKVEDTRDLLENVLYPPTQGRFKVYLIDEVHMLSNHSFNALLKTLEEPPPHVIFILATTDEKRLPVTILSRCLQFHLKRITPQQITKRLEEICLAEKIIYEVPALEKIADAADGSMRDALSLLDQAIAYGQTAIKLDDVNQMLGLLSQDDLFPLVDALITQENNLLFQLIFKLSERAPDFNYLLNELIRIFHQIALAQIIPDINHHEKIKLLANKTTPEDIQLYYQIALLGKRDLPFASSLEQGFEMTLLRMLAFKPAIPLKKEEPESIVDIKETKTTGKITEIKENNAVLNWREILPKLELSGMSYALASNCNLAHFADNKMVLHLSKTHEPMLSQKLKERIIDALNRYFNQSVQLEILITTDELITPQKIEQHEKTAKLEEAKQTVMQDPRVKQLIEMYDATIDEISLMS